MKNMILISLVAFIMTFLNAHAEVYECSSDKQGKYLIALQQESGIIFQNENGYFQDLNSEVKVARAMDGGPTMVIATSQLGNDWQSGGCFVMKTVIRFVINNTSTIQFHPDFEINPDPACAHYSLPRPMVLPPQPIDCVLK